MLKLQKIIFFSILVCMNQSAIIAMEEDLHTEQSNDRKKIMIKNSSGKGFGRVGYLFLLKIKLVSGQEFHKILQPSKEDDNSLILYRDEVAEVAIARRATRVWDANAIYKSISHKNLQQQPDKHLYIDLDYSAKQQALKAFYLSAVGGTSKECTYSEQSPVYEAPKKIAYWERIFQLAQESLSDQTIYNNELIVDAGKKIIMVDKFPHEILGVLENAHETDIVYAYRYLTDRWNIEKYEEGVKGAVLSECHLVKAAYQKLGGKEFLPMHGFTDSRKNLFVLFKEK